MSIKARHEPLALFIFFFNFFFFYRVLSDAYAWATPGDFAGTRRLKKIAPWINSPAH